MKRIPVRRAALVAAALVVSSLVPGFAVPPAGAADPGVAVTGSVHDLAGATIAAPVELLDGQGAYVAGASNTDNGFAFQAPAGHYTLHLETPVPGYADGFRTGDEQASGLFVDLPVDIAGDARFDLTVPIVDFPVHVVGHDGDPAPGVTLAGDSAGPVELAPGAVGTATLKNNRQTTDADGGGTLQIVRDAPPATVTATDDYETLGRVSVAARRHLGRRHPRQPGRPGRAGRRPRAAPGLGARPRLGGLRGNGAARRAGALAVLRRPRAALPPPGRPRRPHAVRQQPQPLGQP